MMRQRWTLLSIAGAITSLSGLAGAQAQQVLYSQNFDALLGSLRPSVNERVGIANVTRPASDAASNSVADAFTHVAPAGWAVDNTLATFGGVPTIGNAGVPGQGLADYGVDEWEGWSFARRDFWVSAAGDQNRSQFTLGSGNVAVADPDEYFDLGDADDATNGGFYNTSLQTPSVPGTFDGADALGFRLSFDTSYRLEGADDDHRDPAFNLLNNQAAEVIAVFDNGEVIRRSVFDSLAPGGVDMTNASVFFDFAPNDVATSAQFFFNLGNAANDWWWAIDNVAVAPIDAVSGLPRAATFTENFDTSVTLGPSVNERQQIGRVTGLNNATTSTPRPDSWSNDAAALGLTIDNSATPAATLGDNNVGVFEWEGWSFATPEFWVFAEDSGRAGFTSGTGVIAVADGDEWTDIGSPATPLNTLLETGAIAVPALDADEVLLLEFDSSWRAEEPQIAVITADFGDGNGPVEVLRWESGAASPFFHDDNTNEKVFVEIDPAGATEIQLGFRYVGGNNWWWAIDNVQLGVAERSVIPEPTSVVLLASIAAALAGARRQG